jgi:TolB-like protein/Tfp pilus assembly protein PilF
MEPVTPGFEPHLDDVREALAAVLCSRYFSGAERRKRLLEYLVEETLAGRGAGLKEYRIGVDVYGKDGAEYDPRTDPVVRVDIGRLRTKLDDYYAAEGRHAPLRLKLPKGAYSIQFLANGAPPDEVHPNQGTGPSSATERAVAYADRRRTASGLWPARLLVAAALLVSVAGASLFWHGLHLARQAPRSLALIPFANLSPDRGTDYLSDGVADEVTVLLGRIKGLRVIARASTSQFRDSKLSPRQIGRRLGADAVLTGSLQRSGNRVRVIAQLNSTADGSQIWSEAFDGDVLDALRLEDRIAGAVAVQLGASIEGRVVKDPAVHDLYLRGRFFAAQQTPAAVLRAGDLFRQGLVRDPRDPECLRGLAATEVWMASMGQKSPREAIRSARALIETAVAVDPNDGMGHLMLGYMLYANDRNWRAAEPELQKAVELSPNSTDVRNNYGYILLFRGRFDEALVQFTHGREIDPLSIMPHVSMCELYANMRDYPHGEAECRTVLEANPKHLGARIELADMLAQEGKYDAAFQELDRARDVMVNPEVALSLRAKFLAWQGNREEASKILRQLEAGPGPASWVLRAGAYLGTGDRDRALVCLETAYREHDGNLLGVPKNPLWAPLRSDPRFQDLVRRIEGQ